MDLGRRHFICALAAAAIAWRDGPQSGYYDAREKKPPRPLLLEALALFGKEGRKVARATDAGCGSGIETLRLLQEGAEVFAFDIDPEAIERLTKRVPAELRARLHAEVASFATAKWARGVDLVFAGFSLPFAKPDEFPSLWSKLVASLGKKGRFAGQFFGPHDAWADMRNMTFHSREQIEKLLAGFHVEVLRETEDDRPMAEGPIKHWHVFDVIAQKVA